MQEARVTHPPLFFNDDSMHYGNLAGGTSKRKCRYAQPNNKGLMQRNPMLTLIDAGRSRWLLRVFFDITQRETPSIFSQALRPMSVAS